MALLSFKEHCSFLATALSMFCSDPFSAFLKVSQICTDEGAIGRPNGLDLSPLSDKASSHAFTSNLANSTSNALSCSLAFLSASCLAGSASCLAGSASSWLVRPLA